MTGKARAIQVDIWKMTDKISNTSFYLMMYLLTSPRSSVLGISEIIMSEFELHTGLTKKVIQQSLEELINNDIVVVDNSTNEFLVTNAFPQVLLSGGKPVYDLIKSEVQKTKSTYLLDIVFKNASKLKNKEFIKNIAMQYLTLGKEGFVNSSGIKKQRGKATKCEWCGRKTTAIQKHHYPIPKRLGGTETVNICPTCHCENHLKEYQFKNGGNNRA